jgi:hypothetical protein
LYRIWKESITRGLTDVPNLNLPAQIEVLKNTLCWDSSSLDRDPNWTPQEYKSEALQLEEIAWGINIKMKKNLDMKGEDKFHDYVIQHTSEFYFPGVKIWLVRKEEYERKTHV